MLEYIIALVAFLVGLATGFAISYFLCCKKSGPVVTPKDGGGPGEEKK